MKTTQVVISLLVMVDTVLSQSATDMDRLIDDLLTINPSVRPVSNVTESTQVNITFQLTSIISLDTADQKLTSNAWMTVIWKSDLLTWDPQDYGGLSIISPPLDLVWKPGLAVANSLKEIEHFGGDNSFVNIDYQGFAMWYPSEIFETYCEIDVTYFPFDSQTCLWEMIGLNGVVNNVDFHSVLPDFDLRFYRQNAEWELTSSRAWVEQSKSLKYEATLRRRPRILIMTMLLPIMVLSVINVFVFTIPSETGERLSYSTTCFLSFGVFLSVIINSLPTSSNTLSILAVNLGLELVLSALYVLLCILSSRLFHRDHHTHPIPSTLQTVIVSVEMMLCMSPPSQHPVLPFRSKVASFPRDDLNDVQMSGKGLKGQLHNWVKERKEKQEVYSQPQDMTWQRVSRTLDKLLFRIFFTVVLIYLVVYIAIMAENYSGTI